MATKKTNKEKQTEIKNTEREYVIPLKEGFRQKPIYKKTPAAVKTIKKFLVRHMKIRDRDLNKIKIDKYLNEFLWFRGIKKPPIKIKIKAVKEEIGTEKEKIRVYLTELPEKLRFKKKREEKLSEKAGKKADEKQSAKAVAEKDGEKEREEQSESKPEDASKIEEKSSEEEKDSEKDKKDLNKKTQSAQNQSELKKQKHITGGKQKEKVAPKRQSLKK